MFIVRWLMSHPILFAWALAALAIILNWGTKSGADHAEPKEVAAVHSQQTTEATDTHAASDSDKIKADQQKAVQAHTPESPEHPVVPTAPVNELEKPSNPAKPDMDAAVKTGVESPEPPKAMAEDTADVSGEAQKESEAIATAENVDATASANASTTSQKADETASVNANTTAQKADDIPSANASITAQQVDETTSANVGASSSDQVAKSYSNSDAVASTAEDTKGKTPDDLLKAAREAFWHNKKDEAATIYKQLIEMQPEVLEHKGELGNVYWHQNKQKESAALYAEIAIPLIKSGKSAQVENMLGFIGAFFPEKATEIHQYLLNNQ